MYLVGAIVAATLAVAGASNVWNQDAFVVSNPLPTATPSVVCNNTYPAEAWFTNACGETFSMYFGKSVATDHFSALTNDSYFLVGAPGDHRSVGRAYKCTARPTASCSEIVIANPAWKDVDNRAGVCVTARDGKIAIGADRRAKDTAPSPWLCLDQTHTTSTCESARGQGMVATMQADLSGEYVYDIRLQLWCNYGACNFGSDLSFDSSLSIISGLPPVSSYRGAFVRLPAGATSPFQASSSSGLSTYDFTGSAVDASSDLDNDPADDVLVGQPRASSKMGKCSIYRGTTNTYWYSVFSLTGTQRFARFGESVLAYDVTGDGRADIFCGAPSFTPSATKYEAGRFTFVPGSAGALPDIGGILNFDGTKVNGWFGFSFGAAGDLNLDGYNDLIVGAPYVGQDPSNSGAYGAIYIYNGGASGPSLSQTILASTIVSTPAAVPKAFGYSVAGGQDLRDDGGDVVYPEVVVGAMESESVFVLKTRTLSSVTVAITRDLVALPLSNAFVNVTFNVCFSNTAGPSPTRPFNYTFVLDVQSSGSQLDRVTIMSPSGCFPQVCSHILVDAIINVGGTYCSQVVAQADKSKLVDSITTPVSANATAYDPEDWVWNKANSRTATVSVPIDSNCTTPSCDTDLGITLRTHPTTEMRVGDDMSLFFDITNVGDLSFATAFSLTPTAGVTAKSLPTNPNLSPFVCLAVDVGNGRQRIDCALVNNPLPSGDTTISNATLVFSTSGVSDELDEISFDNCTVSSQSNDTNAANDVTSVGLALYREADLRMQLSVSPELVGFGQQATFQVRVSNFVGPNSAVGLAVVTTWPCVAGNCTAGNVYGPVRLLGAAVVDVSGDVVGTCDQSFVDTEFAEDFNVTFARRRRGNVTPEQERRLRAEEHRMAVEHHGLSYEGVSSLLTYRPNRRPAPDGAKLRTRRGVDQNLYPLIELLDGNFTFSCQLNTLTSGSVAFVKYVVVVNEEFVTEDASIFALPNLTLTHSGLTNTAPPGAIQSIDEMQADFALGVTSPDKIDTNTESSEVNIPMVAGSTVGAAAFIAIIIAVLYKTGFFKGKERPGDYVEEEVDEDTDDQLVALSKSGSLGGIKLRGSSATLMA